jgi:hypothetical protein
VTATDTRRTGGTNGPPGPDRAASSGVWGRVAVAATVAAMGGVTVAGPRQPVGRMMLLLAIALIGYGATLMLAARGAVTRRLVLAAAVVATTLALVGGPVGSTDVASYAVYGRMVSAHHASPYTHVPADFPQDPWYPRMASFWHRTGSVYGPVFVAASAAGMAWAGGSPLKGRLFFQLLAALAFLGCLLLVDRRTRGDPGALAFVGLNPVLVASVVNGGHNDILVGLAVLAAVVVMMGRRPRPVVAGVILAVGALIKVVALLALVALVAWAWARLSRRIASALAASGFGVTVAGLVAGGGVVTLRPVLHAARQQQLPAFWAYPRRWLTHAFAHSHGAGAAELAQRQVGRAALMVVALVAVLVIAARLRDHSPVPAVTGAMLTYLVGGAYLMAWYPGWVLPVASLRWRSRLAILVAAHSGVLLLAAVDRPSQLHGVVLTVVRLLRDTLLPLAELVIVLVLAVAAIGALTTTYRPRPRPSAR